MICAPNFPDFSAFFRLLFDNKPATAVVRKYSVRFVNGPTSMA
jgi:hypothetical protein